MLKSGAPNGNCPTISPNQMNTRARDNDANLCQLEVRQPASQYNIWVSDGEKQFKLFSTPQGPFHRIDASGGAPVGQARFQRDAVGPDSHPHSRVLGQMSQFAGQAVADVDAGSYPVLIRQGWA